MSPVTASSRFVDGGEFGFGAEIGRVLSTANACAANRGPRLVEVESLDSTCATWAGAAGAGELIASGEVAGKNEATSSRPYAPLNPFPRNDNSVRRRPATRARPRSGGASTLVRRQRPKHTVAALPCSGRVGDRLRGGAGTLTTTCFA